ncbi:MAG: C10 family peptidase, partial [Bacteroidota bacterium]
MRIIFIAIALLLGSALLMAEHVPADKAREVATIFYRMNAPEGIRDYRISDYSATTFNGFTTCYTFFFQAGGFVLVSADDAATPILGFSKERTYSPSTTMSPATAAWLEGYSRQIEQLVQAGASNRETSKRWESIRNLRSPVVAHEIGPFLSTSWGQGCIYNEQCPVDEAGPCDHALTGCVATAMAQVLKYHNFPPEGTGSHEYLHEKYGMISADFGNTVYRWDSMPDHLDTLLSNAVATLMFHAGVSVNMHYGASSSGAYLYDVIEALVNFFNYHPDANYQYKDACSEAEWKSLLCADLEQHLPVIYGGFMPSAGGHAFVCDGFISEDSLFHSNWGWNGSYNGWYAIGALNPGWSMAFNESNSAIFNLKPFPSSVCIRIISPPSRSLITAGDTAHIKVSVLKGNPDYLSLWLDGEEIMYGAGESLEYTWKTTLDDIGSHKFMAMAYSGEDSIFSFITLNVTEWIIQATHFPEAREIHHISAVDSNVAWATARYPGSSISPCHDFIRTSNGGTTWIPGTMKGVDGLVPSMICGVDVNRAYTVMCHSYGENPPGIFATYDGGITWVRQQPDAYSYNGSFPNCIYFFNETDGCCMGDPVDGEFEIYTTSDGGTSWIRVDGTNIPDPQGNEVGIVGWYSAIRDTLWFTTNRGRIFRSCDRGHHWEVFTVGPLAGMYVAPSFLSGSHGLVQQRSPYTGVICETFDGGETWTKVTTSGEIHSWDVSEFFHAAWVNDRTGWLGGTSYLPDKNGIYKYTGKLIPELPSPSMLQATILGYDIDLTWEVPLPDTMGYQLLGYNMYRDGKKVNSSCISSCRYTDCGLSPGEYSYCVRAVYDVKESKPACTKTIIELLPDDMIVGPNPVDNWMKILSGALITEIRFYDITGKEVYRQEVNSDRFDMDVSRFSSGCYVLIVTTASG